MVLVTLIVFLDELDPAPQMITKGQPDCLDMILERELKEFCRVGITIESPSEVAYPYGKRLSCSKVQSSSGNIKFAFEDVRTYVAFCFQLRLSRARKTLV